MTNKKCTSETSWTPARETSDIVKYDAIASIATLSVPVAGIVLLAVTGYALAAFLILGALATVIAALVFVADHTFEHTPIRYKSSRYDS